MTTDLDRLTAERVMGWKAVDVTDDVTGRTFVNYVDSDQRGIIAVDEWCPSTDPIYTFAVVDKLRAEGWALMLDDLRTHWRVVFTKFGVEYADDEDVTATDVDRLTAILLAANAVKGVSEEEVRAACKEQA